MRTVATTFRPPSIAPSAQELEVAWTAISAVLDMWPNGQPKPPSEAWAWARAGERGRHATALIRRESGILIVRNTWMLGEGRLTFWAKETFDQPALMYYVPQAPHAPRVQILRRVAGRLDFVSL